MCGPITPASQDGFKYAIVFIDNFTGYTFVYFIQSKSDSTKALLKFLADITPYGKVSKFMNLVPESELKRLRSDNGGEYMGAEFQKILVENGIRHESSAPIHPTKMGRPSEVGVLFLKRGGVCLLNPSCPNFCGHMPL